jgi:hypothetical protein
LAPDPPIASGEALTMAPGFASHALLSGKKILLLQ